MRIAQLAPLYESVPPQFYGGTERVVSYLTEELVRQGHEVTLFASGDSKTAARLDATCPRALRLDKSCIDCFSYHILMIERVFQRHPQIAVLTTLHGRLDINDIKPVFREFREMPLKVAAKIDPVDEKYYETCIKRLIEGNPAVEYVGEIGEDRKNEFLGKACALLFPIDWPEPFGLVLIEAMACGTPVIARPLGSVPELVKDGVTGFIADTVGDAVRAVHRAARLDRGRIRREFEYSFSAERMAGDYVGIYRRLVSAKNKEFIEKVDSQF